jgi:hypothetical protein
MSTCILQSFIHLTKYFSENVSGLLASLVYSSESILYRIFFINMVQTNETFP